MRQLALLLLLSSAVELQGDPLLLEREQMRQIAIKSPEHAGAKNLEAWLQLFSSRSVTIEDPVGVRAIRVNKWTRKPLREFFNAFIRPNDIWFEPKAADFVAGSSVVRQVVIHTTTSSGLRFDVPCHIYYRMIEDSTGQWRIRNMRAHWNLPAMAKRIRKKEISGIATMLSMGAKVIHHLGLRHSLSFSKAMFGGVGDRGHAVVRKVVKSKRFSKFQEKVTPHTKIRVSQGNSSGRVASDVLFDLIQNSRLREIELISAGNTTSGMWFDSETGKHWSMLWHFAESDGKNVDRVEVFQG